MGVKGIGRRQKPAAQRAMDGSRTRPRHHQQPIVADGEPDCPSWLGDDERPWWQEFAALLRGQRRLTPDTAPWLLAASSAMVDFLRWRALAATTPLLQTKWSMAEDGNKVAEDKPHPAHQQYRLARTALIKALTEAGLTPASVARVVMPAKDEDVDDFDAQAHPQIRRVK